MNEFEHELLISSWDNTVSPAINSNQSLTNFYYKVEKLLDEMAPMKRLTPKEIGLQQRPWITSGLLKSMFSRDKLYKEFVTERNPRRKQELHNLFKTKRNMITTLLRNAKKPIMLIFSTSTRPMPNKPGKELEIC